MAQRIKRAPAVRSGIKPRESWRDIDRTLSLSITLDKDGTGHIGLTRFDTQQRQMWASHAIHLLGVESSERGLLEALYIAAQYYMALAAQGKPL